MRVLIVTPTHENKMGAHYYNTSRKLINGFVRNDHAVVTFSDRDVARASNFLHNRKLGKGAANKKLLMASSRFRPEMICIGHSSVIRVDTIAEIRHLNPEIRIALYNIDPLFTQTNVRDIAQWAEIVDGVFITSGGEPLRQFSRPGNRVCFLPNPVDSSVDVLKQFSLTETPADVICTVGGYTPDDRRATALAARDAVPEGKFELYGMDGRGPVFGARYFDAIARAKMGLNLSRRNDCYLYSSDRMATYMGCGLLTLVDRATSFGEFFTEDEVAFYDSGDDLADRIRYYLAHDDERRRVAERGWRKSHEELNERLVTRYIEEVTFDRKLTHDYIWPTQTY